MPLRAFTLTLENGAKAQAVRLAPGGEVSGLADALALPPCRGTIAVVGGAKGIEAPQFEALRADVSRLLSELAELAAAQNLAVIDGGTPHGVMRLLGEARAGQGGSFPLVGVAPLGKVTWADRAPGEGGKTSLDANHSAFVLVEADLWGEEVDTLAATAHTLASGGPTLEILVNGGQVARQDVQTYLKRGGQLVTVEGSGRFADELAAALKRNRSKDADLQAILDTGRVHAFPLDSPPGAFAALLSKLAGW